MTNKKNLAQFIIVTLAFCVPAVLLFLPSIREWILSQNGFGILIFGFGFSLLFDSALKIGLSIFRKPFWVTPVLVMSFGGVIRGIEYGCLCISLISIILYFGIGIGIAICRGLCPETPQNQEH